MRVYSGNLCHEEEMYLEYGVVNYYNCLDCRLVDLCVCLILFSML